MSLIPNVFCLKKIVSSPLRQQIKTLLPVIFFFTCKKCKCFKKVCIDYIIYKINSVMIDEYFFPLILHIMHTKNNILDLHVY